jgi:hypothetical protein
MTALGLFDRHPPQACTARYSVGPFLLAPASCFMTAGLYEREETEERAMPIMLEKPYDALRAANVPEDKARAAAVEAAEFHTVAEIKPTQRLHTWILSVNTAMIVAIVGKLFLNH